VDWTPGVKDRGFPGLSAGNLSTLAPTVRRRAIISMTRRVRKHFQLPTDASPIRSGRFGMRFLPMR